MANEKPLQKIHHKEQSVRLGLPALTAKEEDCMSNGLFRHLLNTQPMPGTGGFLRKHMVAALGEFIVFLG